MKIPNPSIGGSERSRGVSFAIRLLTYAIKH
jgi:hypothetical protein